MLTVKQILSTGVEIVFEASRINYVPKSSDEAQSILFIEGPDFFPRDPLVSGIYYVMNDAGNTVAKYDLGPEPQI